MSITTHFHLKSPAVRAGLLSKRRGSIARPLAAVALAGIVAFAAQQAVYALRSPGEAIRGDLRNAASDARALPMLATPAEVQEAIAPNFTGYDATVDARGFPSSMAVTLHGLDRASCLDARTAARRLEGSVVVELSGYSSATDCGQHNDMTWRIMP